MVWLAFDNLKGVMKNHKKIKLQKLTPFLMFFPRVLKFLLSKKWNKVIMDNGKVISKKVDFRTILNNFRTILLFIIIDITLEKSWMVAKSHTLEQPPEQSKTLFNYKIVTIVNSHVSKLLTCSQPGLSCCWHCGRSCGCHPTAAPWWRWES